MYSESQRIAWYFNQTGSMTIKSGVYKNNILVAACLIATEKVSS